MLKLKVLNWSLCLLQVYAPNARSKYQAFVDEVNDALLRLSPTESTVLMEDFLRTCWNRRRYVEGCDRKTWSHWTE